MNFLILIESEDYVSTVIKILKEVYVNESKRILYITLSRPYKSLDMDLFREDINKEKIIVIDTITKRILPNIENSSSCYYVRSPTSFAEIIELVDYLFKEFKFDHVIFDSLSSLSIYSMENEAIHFINELLLRISVIAKCESSFLCIGNDKDSPIITKTATYFDRVINMQKK